eukprot:gene10808-biopygen2289
MGFVHFYQPAVVFVVLGEVEEAAVSQKVNFFLEATVAVVGAAVAAAVAVVVVVGTAVGFEIVAVLVLVHRGSMIPIFANVAGALASIAVAVAKGFAMLC